MYKIYIIRFYTDITNLYWNKIFKIYKITIFIYYGWHHIKESLKTTGVDKLRYYEKTTKILRHQKL